MAEKIKAVIFDQDGLMFDTERLAQDAWEAALEAYNIHLGKDFFRDLRGAKADKVKEALIRRFGTEIDYDSIFREKRQYSFRWVREHGVPVKPGLLELLDYLKAHDVKMAVATSSSREWTRGNVKSAGVEAYFDEYIYGDMVDEAKPNPAIFLLAARKLSMKPGECLVLEDSFNGIKAAAAGGFHPVMVPDQDQPDREILALLSARRSNLSEVIGLFEDGTFECPASL